MVTEPPQLAVYQFHFFLLHVSPAIWRRVLVRSDSTVADLHRVVQISMGWSNAHLHRFDIRGVSYGECCPGGSLFSGDWGRSLSSFAFRDRERFLYEYDLLNGWRLQVRLERRLPYDPAVSYPRCIGGRRRAVPEDCGGPEAFVVFKDRYSPLDLLILAEDIVSWRDGGPEPDWRQLSALQAWLASETFDRRTVNRWLRRSYSGDEVVAYPQPTG